MTIDITTPGISAYDAFEIERQARIARSRFMAEGLRLMVRALVLRLRGLGKGDIASTATQA